MIYQENLRVPLVIADPVRPATHGSTTTSLTSHIDLVPTLAAIAGATTSLDWMHGHDLTPLLDDPTSSVRDGLLVTSDAASSGLALPGLKYVIRGVLTDQYSYGRYSTPQDVNNPGATFEHECYDRNADPGELHNLANDPSSASIRADLDSLVDEIAATELQPLT
jgi:arylsulfatase A-like enzyme